MKKCCTLLGVLLCAVVTHAQISISGNTTPLSTPNNAPAIVVDNSLAVSGSATVDAVKVTITTNFNTGDVLGFTGTLPPGVSGTYDANTGILTFSGSATNAQWQTLLRTVTFSTTATNVLQRKITFSLGSAVPNPGNGHFYEFISGLLTWTEAKAEAGNKRLYGLEGYLATITSQAENDFILQKTAADGWVGGSDDYNVLNNETGTNYTAQTQTEGKFYWVTGPEKGMQMTTANAPDGSSLPPVSGSAYNNWNTGEPNNWNNTNENFIQFFSSGAYAGRWNDLPNTNTLGYVVEYGGMPGDPAVNLTHSRTVSLIATAIRSTPQVISYDLKAPAFIVDDNITVTSVNDLTNATVTISSGFKSGDVLNYGTLPAGITGSYNNSNGILSFTGTTTPANWQSLLRSVKFNSTSTEIGNRTISFSVGNLISGSNGHFYEYVTTNVNWVTAKSNAAAKTYLGLQGYLATITSQMENDFIQQKLTANGWIGASDEFAQINTAKGTTLYADQTASEGKWYWVTGPEKGMQMTTANAPDGSSLPPVSGSAYNNWNTGEPNNSPNEHYAQIYSSGGGNAGKWNDLGAAATMGYVVEYGGLSTDPLLELSASRTIIVSKILPIFDLQFDLVTKNGAVVLTWSTAREEQTERFDVQHSTDGRSFTKIGEIAASQNSTVRHQYTFTHSVPADGKNFYRLQIVDRDGAATFSPIRQMVVKTNLNIMPNPFQHQFTVTNPFKGAAVLLVKNAAGAVVLRQNLTQAQTQVDGQMLPAGMYFAEVVKDNTVSEPVKLIKR